MKKYESYKDSGVEWIGEVPIHWKVVPLKFTGTFGNGLTYSPNDIVEDGVLVLRSSNIQNSELSFDDNVYVSHVPQNLLVNKGDIIICSRNGSAALVGKCAFIKEDINATFGAFMMRYIPKIENRYGFYLFQTAIGRYKGYFATTTINQLTKSTIGEMKVPVADINEQDTIATYLDKKCSEIDKVISTQQKRIALLQELKQSVITHAVTKGLNPNVEMKDSCVEWIGEVPKHWEVIKIKQICKNEKYAIKTGPFGTQLKGQELQPDGDVVVYNQRNVIDNNFNNSRFYVTKEKAKSLSSFYTNPQDVLVTSRGTIGRAAILDGKYPMGILHPCLIAIRVNENICSQKWLVTYINETDCFKTDITLSSNATTIDVIYTDTIKNIVLPVPPLSEQQNISTYLDKKCASIDASISKAQHQVDLLQEYKQSLITEVVTGKRKVY